MNDKTSLIQIQNDEFRQRIMIPAFGIPEVQGKYLMTAGLQNLGPEAQIIIAAHVRDFDKFTEDNDPHGEHDFGSLTYEGRKIFWKIDYYDTSYEMGSEEPSDPAKTRRVLTIMLASEY